MWTFGSFPLLLDRGEDEGKESKFRSITESCERLRCHWCSLVWRVSEAAPKKTPLYDEHVRLGARMVSFAGWLMPVQYTSIVEEHQAVRNNVGIFDISHMGQLIVEGASACEWLNTMLTNNVGKLDLGTGQYTFLLSDRGGIIDDLIVYRIGQQKFLLVVNAARANEDFAWLQGHFQAANAVPLVNRSSDFGGVAIQGPRIAELFRALFGTNADLPPRNSIADFPFEGTTVSIARFEQQTQGKFGTPRSKKAKRSESSRAVWARATRCALKCVTPSTAQIFRRNEIRSRQDWDSLSI